MKRRRVTWLAAAAVAVGMIGWWMLPKPPLLEGVAFSTVVKDRDGKVLRIKLANDDKLRVFTPLEDISPRLVTATLFHEDRYFGTHPGVNPVALVRAAWRWLTGPAHGGASTITMQVARLRYHLQTRSLSGKLAQIFDALCLERHYSKHQILEAYFNLTPYGGNVEGAGAAAGIYLQHSPVSLSWAEAVTLAVIPQSPAARRPLPQSENSRLMTAHRLLYLRMLAAKTVTDPLGQDYSLRWAGRLPAGAPHLVDALVRENPRQPELRTTIDESLQRLLERNIREYVTSKGATGVHNAAGMLVNTHTMEVLASVGSADFSNSQISGQVDGTSSARSPGSTLKPFIYALALDQGLIHPQTLLLDAPQRFADYCPDNFDREFCGPISASHALVRSRNVPAVDLASRLHSPRFYDFLRRSGAALRDDESTYGLSLALGGAEVTMQDLVRLYAMLANGGVLKPLRMTRHDAPPPSGPRLLSPEAAYLTLDMLANAPRPDSDEIDRAHTVAWKTGTSYGFRDAWTVAVFDHFVLAVWVGNFDGRGNPAFVGRTCAAPLLFRMLDGLVRDNRARLRPLTPPPGSNLKQVQFCAVSGDLPSAHCANRVSGWFIPGVSPITTCPVHREIWVDEKSGLRRFEDNGACRRVVVEFWPSNVLEMFAQAGLPRRSPPPFAPDCAVDFLARKGRAPLITSPSANELLVARTKSDNRVILEARTDGDVQTVYWFEGTKFLGSSSPGRPLPWRATAGSWQLVALDDQGRRAARSVRVVADSR